MTDHHAPEAMPPLVLVVTPTTTPVVGVITWD